MLGIVLSIEMKSFSLFQGTGSRMGEKGLKLHKERFGLDVSKNAFTKRVVRHWNRLPRTLVESLFL